MSRVETAIALFVEKDIGHAPDPAQLFPASRDSENHSSGDTWAVHQAVAQARSALVRLCDVLPTNDPRLSDLRPYIATLLKSTVQSNTGKLCTLSYRPLSRRETGILQMIAHGMSNKRIAQSLGITPETVKSHAKNIFVKLATRTRAQAVARAEASGFL